MPMLVFSAFEASVLKLKSPLKFEVRWAGRVVRSRKNPALNVCDPAAFVIFVEKFHRVLYPKKGKRFSTPSERTFPGTPPPNAAFGTRYIGFASGKYCGSPGSTFVRSFLSSSSWLTAAVFWCDQLTPTVNSPYSVGLNV